MENCIFCKIINKEVPSIKIYEDNNFLAILDIRPATKYGGHVLLMPKKHFELITDLSDDLLSKCLIAIKQISKALLKFGKGLNILQNNKKVAGQAIPHVHFHLIPRFPNDNITVERWITNEYGEGEAERVAAKIRSFLK
ncbi:MAG: HIT family protein [Nanoarchaeota archaeon]